MSMPVIDPAAAKRVRDALPAPYTCRYCQSPVELVSNSQIYGREYGKWPWVYLCTNNGCRAFVGTHPGSNLPLGTLADGPLREARKKAHAVFDPIWRSGHMSRKEAYQWLAKQLGIERSQCHIGMFEADQCERVVQLAAQVSEQVFAAITPA